MGDSIIRFFLFVALTIALAWLPAEAKQPRSYAAKAEFKRMNPCPANGERRGKCPGFDIDHAIPLKCGGSDHPKNMQWLSVDDHKAKTRNEAKLCRTSK